MEKIKKTRLEVLDLMQGIAMLWVLIGHHLLPIMPSGYSSFQYYIYSFHMPLFIAISGFLIAYSYKNLPYKAYVWKRFKKFFVPYFWVGMTISVLAGFSQGWESFLMNVMDLVIAPLQSEATFLWYIYLLFFLYALYPVIHRISRLYPCTSAGVGLLLGCIGYGYSWSCPYFCLGYLTKFFLFYFLGILCAHHVDFFFSHRKKVLWLANVGLFAFLFFSLQERLAGGSQFLYHAICLTSFPAMLALAKLMQRIVSCKQGLVWISKNCFAIYLLHMFFVQALALIVGRLQGGLPLGTKVAVIYVAVSSLLAMWGAVYLFKMFYLVKNRLL